MNKVELIAKIAETNEITKKKATESVDMVLSAIKDVMAEGENVKLSGFGSFEVVDRPARTGRNPQDGTPIEIAAYKAPKFKASSALKALVKG